MEDTVTEYRGPQRQLFESILSVYTRGRAGGKNRLISFLTITVAPGSGWLVSSVIIPVTEAWVVCASLAYRKIE
jgi:hypothetical protein